MKAQRNWSYKLCITVLILQRKEQHTAKVGMAYPRSQHSEENVKTVRYQRVLLDLHHFIIIEGNKFGCTFNHLEGKGITILPSD